MPGDSSSVLLDEGFTHEATSGYPGKATDDAKIAVRDAFHDARSDSTNQRKRPGDSAESERERKRFQEAAKESCDISIPENSERDILELSRSQLREHSERKSAIFFIELTPPSLARGARCQLMDCENKINVDDYRFAVCPGMNNVYGSSGERDT